MNATGNELYQVFFENSPTVAFLVDPVNGDIVDANKSAQAFYGFSREQLRSMTWYGLSTNTPEQLARDLRHAFAGTRQTFYSQHCLADGSVRDVKVNAARVRLGGANVIYLTVADVTTQRQIERALRQTENTYGRLVDIMPTGLVIQAKDERIIFTNERFCIMMNATHQQLYAADIWSLLHEDDHQTVRDNLERRQLGESSIYEARLYRYGGGTLTVLISATPLIDANGDYQGSLSIVTDITDRIRIEEELIERNQELDAFAHTVAHDLKGPLSVLVGFATVLEEDYDAMESDQVRESLQIIGRTSEKMVSIINELLLLAQMRKAEVTPRPINMNQVVEEALSRMRFMLDQYRATLIVQPDLPPAMGYAAWLEEVWTNYISNAMKYGGTPPRIEIGATRQTDGRILYWVLDNGQGIPEDKLDKLFVPFERLNALRVQGHGLGLSIAKRIMEKLGGEVRVRSQVGRGSAFGFVLPSVPA
jgi:PAS domain S-box-containing protein